MMISMDEWTSMRAGQLVNVVVGQLVIAKKLWRVDRVFWCSVSSWVLSCLLTCCLLFQSQTVIYSGDRITFPGDQTQCEWQYTWCWEALTRNHYDDNYRSCRIVIILPVSKPSLLYTIIYSLGLIGFRLNWWRWPFCAFLRTNGIAFLCHVGYLVVFILSS